MCDRWLPLSVLAYAFHFLFFFLFCAANRTCASIILCSGCWRPIVFLIALSVGQAVVRWCHRETTHMFRHLLRIYKGRHRSCSTGRGREGKVCNKHLASLAFSICHHGCISPSLSTHYSNLQFVLWKFYELDNTCRTTPQTKHFDQFMSKVQHCITRTPSQFLCGACGY